MSSIFFLAISDKKLYYYIMYKILRITFGILAALIVAAAIFIFVYAGWLWGFVAVLGAFVCGALMATFKTLQEKEERKKNPPPPVGDFITGKVTDDTKDTKDK